MHTARMTFLMPPQRKAAIEANAAQRGISSAEYARQAFDLAEDRPTADEELELSVLVDELNQALPRIRGSLDRSNAMLETMNAEMDAFLTRKGF